MTIPVAVALAAGIATTASAYDQIVAHATGEGFMPDDVRTGFDIAALAGGLTGAAIGARKAPEAARKISTKYQTWKNAKKKAAFDAADEERARFSRKKDFYSRTPVIRNFTDEGIDRQTIIEYRMKIKKYEAFSEQDRSMGYITSVRPYVTIWGKESVAVKRGKFIYRSRMMREENEAEYYRLRALPEFVIMKRSHSPAQILKTKEIKSWYLEGDMVIYSA
ncbi:hypothetical protein EES43_07995 [Streptomyces sp. ADI96-02]|uniref:hypothetical protein n=1 Tax=Streptomyces sp. ADI96-02 TaxID=1522760 RepID=UPI000F551AA0|nr:hypothetical protein [Streptomyces sp. ADI96-02]RPK65438.1 hypothetical protein EES43_07995 [Streptomyces sp. ADI96-02]